MIERKNDMMETILTALFAVGLLVLKDRLKRFAFHKSAHKTA